MFLRQAVPCLLFAILAGRVNAQVAADRQAIVHALNPVLADGFDFPVGKPNADGYHKARGFSLGNHPGEDWDGIGGGNSDLGDPVTSIADGVVVCARDAHSGWGNIIMVRYQFRERGALETVDALFAHLDTMLVKGGEKVARGQQLGTVGTAHGRYLAHLHFEIRKNLDIGLNRAAFPCDFSCYYDPTKFITGHRHLGPALAERNGLFACARALQLPAAESSLTTRPAAASNPLLPEQFRSAKLLPSLPNELP